MGLCVNPNLNIKGSSLRKSASVTPMACCRIAPAVAFRSHNLKLIQLNVWHLVTRASSRGESGGICWWDVGIVRSRYPILILLYLHSGLSSWLSHSRFAVPELALGWPEGIEDFARVHGNGPSLSWICSLKHYQTHKNNTCTSKTHTGNIII